MIILFYCQIAISSVVHQAAGAAGPSGSACRRSLVHWQPGIILGPMLLDVVERNDLIVSLAELGVIVLMFSAGLETDIQELKKAGLASFVIALLGVIVPLVGGFFLADFYNTEQNPEMASLFWQNIFIGVVLTATSVSITVETRRNWVP